jgi:hypothetical protein
MTNEEFFHLSLPKWPALIVSGEKITEEQAWEIIIRTNSFYDGNNKSWNKTIANVFGYTLNEYSSPDYESVYKVKDKLKCLNLEYLYNSRIVSSWVGGTHGWCHWNGDIHSNNYNIGKWPSIKEVFLEWEQIAKEFPFLELKSQLLSGEVCEEDAVPVINFIVSKGSVSMESPCEQLTSINSEHLNRFDFRNYSHEKEIGETTLRMAVSYVQNKMK